MCILLVFIQFYDWWCTEPWTWRLKVYISLDDSVARGVTIRASSWIMRWHLHLHITSCDEEKDFTVWLGLRGTSITWWWITPATTQCGSQSGLKNWTQNESLLNQLYLNGIWDPVLDPYLKFFVSFSFSYASSPFFVLSLLLTLLLAFFLQCFLSSFNYIIVTCFLFTIILLFATLLCFILYYFAISFFLFLCPSSFLSIIITPSYLFSFHV
jgi:hypothetical protein